MPMSAPRVRLMVHMAKKPAMVVRDEAEMDEAVLQMARVIHSSSCASVRFVPPRSAFSSSKRCSRKIEKSIVTPS